MLNLFDLSGKVAIVTGGTGVLGSAMSKALACAGAKVAVLGRRKDQAKQVAHTIKENGGEAMALPADVLKRKSLEEAKKKVMGSWGSIDILVNAAGGNVPGAVVSPGQCFTDLNEEDLKQVTDLNQFGTMLPSMIFCSEMIKQKHGIVVNISSMAAQMAITRVMGYGAAKAAIDNFTKWLAVELSQKYGDGIRVNAIAPGFFIGEQNHKLLLNEDGSLTTRSEKIINKTPMRRFGKAEELNGTLIWLCSDASRFVTGTVIPVDGGFSAFSGV